MTVSATAPNSFPATVEVVQGYLADLGRGDPTAAAARFSEELTYLAPGRNTLAGERHGRNAAGQWFAGMAELSDGTYGIDETLDWLSSESHALLIARERATVSGRERVWTRAIDFSIEDESIDRVQLFEDDQYGYDEWLSGGAGASGTSESIAGWPDHQTPEGATPTGPPQMSGALDDPRVRAVLSYQRQVAAGDLDSARSIFWPDVTYTVPGESLLSGTYRGPDEVMGYLGKLFALTENHYTISSMHWLTSPDRVGLLTRNHATRNGRALSWDELIVFTFVDGRKKQISHFSADQYGVDRLFS